MVLLDFGTGLRRGELSGVRWEDIYFEDKVLIPMTQPPKTGPSRM
jgi:integrase